VCCWCANPKLTGVPSGTKSSDRKLTARQQKELEEVNARAQALEASLDIIAAANDTSQQAQKSEPADKAAVPDQAGVALPPGLVLSPTSLRKDPSRPGSPPLTTLSSPRRAKVPLFPSWEDPESDSDGEHDKAPVRQKRKFFHSNIQKPLKSTSIAALNSKLSLPLLIPSDSNRRNKKRKLVSLKSITNPMAKPLLPKKTAVVQRELKPRDIRPYIPSKPIRASAAAPTLSSYTTTTAATSAPTDWSRDDKDASLAATTTATSGSTDNTTPSLSAATTTTTTSSSSSSERDSNPLLGLFAYDNSDSDEENEDNQDAGSPAGSTATPLGGLTALGGLTGGLSSVKNLNLTLHDHSDSDDDDDSDDGEHSSLLSVGGKRPAPKHPPQKATTKTRTNTDVQHQVDQAVAKAVALRLEKEKEMLSKDRSRDHRDRDRGRSDSSRGSNHRDRDRDRERDRARERDSYRDRDRDRDKLSRSGNSGSRSRFSGWRDTGKSRH